VRHRWAAQQRVWLGPDRHRQRRGDTVTNSEPESYAHSNSDAVCMRTDAIADTYRLPNGDRYFYSNSNSHTFRHTYAYRYPNGYG